MSEKITDEAMIPDIIREMTLEDKVNFIITPSPCITYSMEELGIEPIVLADGATGVNGTHIMLDFLQELMEKMRQMPKQSAGQASGMGNPWLELQELISLDETEALKVADGNPMKMGFMKFLKSRRNPEGRFVAFPSGVNIGACFNEGMAYQIGKAVGKELRASRVDVCLGPNVDIVRDPLGGRNYEMYGEDPILVGRTGAAFVRGMQSTGTAACAKHFIANNQETRRQTKDTHVSSRTLRELYAKGFEKAVKEGGIKSVMSAYNAVNGTFSSYNKMLLTDWLKEEWGFDGLVVSDWGAVTGCNDKAVAAGMDMVLHGPSPCDGTDIAEAVKAGILPESRVDNAVERLLRLLLWQKKTREENPETYHQEALLKCAYDTVVDGMVLLKNEGVLPLEKSVKAAFYGKRARETMECGSGSTFVTTSLHSNVYDESRKLGVQAAFEDMQDADVVIYTAGAEGGENADRPDMNLDQEDAKKVTAVLKQAKAEGKKTAVILNIAGPVDMREWIQYADAVLVLFVPGCMGGKAAADVLFGEAMPCGRLPVTFPNKLSDSPAAPYPIGEYEDVYYGEGIFVGYRWYDYKELPVQYPFGYGLSYTSFKMEIQGMAKQWDIREQDTLHVSVRVKNVGDHYGCEVIQLYMGLPKARIPMPEKELKSFVKVYLEPGEEQTVTLTVKREDLEICDPEKGLILPLGEYVVKIGVNSESIFSQSNLHVLGNNPYVIDENTTLGEILENPHATAIMDKYIPGFAISLGEHIKLMSGEKIGPLLSRQLIRSIPDANELKMLLDGLFEELSRLE
ncbi:MULTISPECIES: glycoside hydrolase family 3 N-terminal domain-containing protein [Blautia]|uniref:glycoside hydrolase family 3 N-terminal domain-containing protein n=1 Tax=Blautia TaxID=572511 RepID=UPI000BA45ED7|nr:MULTISPECIES: glycoside hydrolase family 3 N-terminal domain-containing protein [Blautia]